MDSEPPGVLKYGIFLPGESDSSPDLYWDSTPEAAASLRALLRRMNHTSPPVSVAASMANPATPPITPPVIAPMRDELDTSSASLVGVGLAKLVARVLIPVESLDDVEDGDVEVAVCVAGEC